LEGGGGGGAISIMASYAVHEFLGDGVLKEITQKLADDGWDDVPTLKMMQAEDMEAIDLTDPQRVRTKQASRQPCSSSPITTSTTTARSLARSLAISTSTSNKNKKEFVIVTLDKVPS
jgi:hypothetical protein